MKRLAILVLAVGAALPVRAEYIDMYREGTDVGPVKVPRLGHSKVLVLPVEVKTHAGFDALDRPRLERFFVEPSETEFRFTSYFQANSSNRYTPEVTLAPTMFFDGCPPELGAECTIARGDVEVLKDGLSILRRISGVRAPGAGGATRTACPSSASTSPSST